jgi:hypothetical protein
MQFVEIYDDIFNSNVIDEIRNEFQWKDTTGTINILNEIDHLSKLDFIKCIVLGKGANSPVIAHTLNAECYDLTTKDHVLWEPHHDGKECKIITLLFVDVDTNGWVGGELDIYKSLDVFNFPNNKTRIEPKPGRLVLFESSMIHAIRPYFGKKSRKTISIGWK